MHYDDDTTCYSLHNTPTVLSILGIGLMWFAISAFGKSRASEQEAAMVDKAVESMARSIQSGVGAGVAAVASLPARLLSFLASIITFPFRLVEKGFSGLGRTGENIISAVSSAFHAILALPGVIIRAAMTKLELVGQSISARTSERISRIGAAISASFIGSILHSVATASSSVTSAVARFTEPFRHFFGTGLNFVGESLSKLSAGLTGAISAAGTCVNAVVAVGGRVAGNATVRLSGLCSRYGGVIQASVISLAAKSDHAQAVTMELIQSVSSRCGSIVQTCVASITDKSGALFQSLTKRGSEVEDVTLKIVRDLGTSLANAGAQISSAVAAVASWCSNLFRRNDRGDSTTSSTI